jgi:sodium-dependent phosphate cotransporter
MSIIKASVPIKFSTKLRLLYKIVSIPLGVCFFILSLDLLSSSFGLIGTPILAELISATSNPFVGLFIGLLSTAILQSSSTVTATLVAIVASGVLTLNHALPIVIGANVGTTVTSTFVSLSYITRRFEFRKAVATATMHDFFNILVALILFPLEYFTGAISHTASVLAGLANVGPGQVVAPVMPERLVSSFLQSPALAIMIGIFGIFFSIKILSSQIKALLIGESQKNVENLLFGSPNRSLFAGILFTGAIQSSSVSTSLVLPMVATGKVSLERAYPFIIGANLGTTITAIVAAFFRSDAALGIALAHFLFNFTGFALFYLLPPMRRVPIAMANALGRVVLRYRIGGFIYILLTFFVLPFLLIYFSQ